MENPNKPLTDLVENLIKEMETRVKNLGGLLTYNEKLRVYSYKFEKFIDYCILECEGKDKKYFEEVANSQGFIFKGCENFSEKLKKIKNYEELYFLEENIARFSNFNL